MSPFLTIILAGALFAFSPICAYASEALHPPFIMESAGGRVSIDAREIEISKLLLALSEMTKTDIVIDNGVSGKITIKLSAATIEEALRAICQNSAVEYEYNSDAHSWRVLRRFAFSESNANSPKSFAAGKEDGNGIITQQPGHIAAAGNIAPAVSGTSAPASAAADSHQQKRPAYKKGELLIRFTKTATPEKIADLHAKLGSSVIREIPRIGLQRIRLRDGADEKDALRAYRENPLVEHVELHALRYPQATPDDPAFSSQWNMKKIAAEATWDISTGNPEIIVAVIDSGVDYAHPDLQENIWVNAAEKSGVAGVDDDNNGYTDDFYGWDFAGMASSGDNDPMDPYGHGTHISGIIGAVGNNGIGVAGMNWTVRIMPLKVMQDSDPVHSFLEADILEAIKYAIDNGADVVNCSFGGPLATIEEYIAFKNLKLAGVISACAAGNDGQDMDKSGKNYPACYSVDNSIIGMDDKDVFCLGLDNILSVANANSSDALSSSSNYGKTTVDVAAPGESIYSTAPLSGTTASVRLVDASPAVEYPALGMEYAAQTPTEGIVGALYDCGMGYKDYTCGTEVIDQIPAAVSGNIALIQRGKCDGKDFTFSQKVANAMAKGAVGVIIYNNLENDADDNFDVEGGTLGAPGNWIPVVSIPKTSGETLISLVARAPLEVALINKLTVNPYKTMSGTSMAAPHVAGLAALLYGQCPTVGYASVRSAIINNVEPLKSLRDKIASGGRINAYRTLKSIFPPGDLSADCRIDLADAILALGILSGNETPLPCPLAAFHLDANGDGVVGLAEVIYILQTLVAHE